MEGLREGFFNLMFKLKTINNTIYRHFDTDRINNNYITVYQKNMYRTYKTTDHLIIQYSGFDN